MSTNAEFDKAAEIIKQLVADGKLSNNEMLKAYGLFKQGSGANFETASKPWTADFRGMAKYRAWGEVKDVSVEDAQKQYIELAEEYKQKYA